MERPLVVLDTETASLQGAPHMIELGAVRVVDGEVADTFESFARPEVSIEPEATEIHGIGPEDVRDAPPPEEVLAAFTDWAGDDWLAAHNAAFDARVLGFEYARAALEPPPGVFLDSLQLARRFLPEAPDHKLTTLCEHLELEGGPPHRALSDAVYCWKLIEECRTRAGAPSMAGLLAACGRPLTIAAAAPTPPRLPRRLRPISNALADAEPVTLLYGAPLDEPARLPVQPRFLFERRGKGYLEAECGLTGLLKTYRLDRVQRVLSG